MRRVLGLSNSRWLSGGPLDPPSSGLSVGQRLHGYEVLSVAPVTEKALETVVLRHEATGAHHLHVAAHDSNNVFAVTFLTVPQDSSGAPHILEHKVGGYPGRQTDQLSD